MTVSGLTMISASRQSFQRLERQTQKRRSRRRSFGRVTVRLRTRICCRRTRISVASDSLETNRERKNRKNAEKMAIRVEGSSSGECDNRWNRIAASSAKCKGNKARWNFYQGQGSSECCSSSTEDNEPAPLEAQGSNSVHRDNSENRPHGA